eukprot:TRINITY_DN29407_c0_g1_i1.p1 TRINITY_DN29407_c0_g1~~TRINITY_DN29407_c0_g1_i1.p1  ORF type:complete len:285 (+),score=32.18 TRINITY_DN29407_c0_g1_i1:80-934(+)
MTNKDRNTMANQPSSAAIRAAAESEPNQYLIVDHHNKANTIQVNKKNVYFSHGKERYVPGKEAILCQRFHQGNCPLGIRCPRMHVSPKCIREKRVAAENCLRCCCIHDWGSCTDKRQILVRWQSNDVTWEHLLPVGCMTAGKALDALPTEGHFLVAEKQQFCRLHLQSKCTFGSKCSHLHICRHIWAEWLEDDETTESNSQEQSTTDFRFEADGLQDQSLSLSSGADDALCPATSCDSTNAFNEEMAQMVHALCDDDIADAPAMRGPYGSVECKPPIGCSPIEA